MLDEALAYSQCLIGVPSVTPAQIDVVDVARDILGDDFLSEYFVFRHDDDSMTHGAMFSYDGGHSDIAFCFAGHLDVVPPGSGWSGDPFVPRIEDGMLIGRGAADMKTAIGCFMAAARSAITDGLPLGKISVLLTGDEERSASPSMGHIIDLLNARGVTFDFFLVGEPTSDKTLGDTVKIGRRGSCNFQLTIKGKQGHVAYPHLARNPIDDLPKTLEALLSIDLDNGTDDFQPSKLVATNVSAGNTASNVVPGSVSIMFNIRFNTLHTPEKLFDKINEACSRVISDYDLSYTVGAEPFLSDKHSKYVGTVIDAIKHVTNQDTHLSTSGGTSDARFLYKIAPVIELGHINKTAHAVDERVSIDDIAKLTLIYYEIIHKIFAPE